VHTYCRSTPHLLGPKERKEEKRQRQGQGKEEKGGKMLPCILEVHLIPSAALSW